jgi:futalosine hydrolase
MTKTLILIPTDLERRGLGLQVAKRHAIDVALCGFGPVAAAARAAGVLAEHRPDRVILVGIAGRFDPRIEIGAAYQFAAVACFGVGAGSGDAFLPAGGMGWSQWPGDPASPHVAIGDEILLTPSTTEPSAGQLLTACAASSSAHDVDVRRRLFPSAVAEDMEGFGVAMACRLAGVPLTIIRGISNTAGDRDTSRWQITAALEAAAALVQQLVEADV